MKTLEQFSWYQWPSVCGAFVCGVFIRLPRNCITRHDLWRISSATLISGGRQSVNERNQYKSVYRQLTYTHLSTIYTLSNYLYVTTGKNTNTPNVFDVQPTLWRAGKLHAVNDFDLDQYSTSQILTHWIGSFVQLFSLDSRHAAGVLSLCRLNMITWVA